MEALSAFCMAGSAARRKRTAPKKCGMILGIDGCREGWVAIGLDYEGRFVRAGWAPTLRGILKSDSGLSVAGIDMPLRLLDAPRRPADLTARRSLGPDRGRSVFPAIPRFAIESEWLTKSYDAVVSECLRRYGTRISRQSFALRGKIAEANAARESGLPVIEVHPELSFQVMNGGERLQFAKKCWGGQRQRLALLEARGIHFPGELPRPVSLLAPDDVIDAAAAAWSAWRYVNEVALRLPPDTRDPDEPAIFA